MYNLENGEAEVGWDSSALPLPHGAKTMNGEPDWWFSKGRKLLLVEESAKKLVLEGTTASLKIVYKGVSDSGSEPWFVEYGIKHSGKNWGTNGTVRMYTPELKSAFCGVDRSFGRAQDDAGRKRIAYTAISMCTFVRYGQCLNIPCAGMAHAGDPNISVYVWPAITAAVMRLIERNIK